MPVGGGRSPAGPDVEILWTGRGKPVRILTTKKTSRGEAAPAKVLACTVAFSRLPSLVSAAVVATISLLGSSFTKRGRAMPSRPVRIKEQINGREYRIEISPVSADKWRAQVLSAHGGPTALMPFYGTTPELAASSLTAWLARVHRGSTPAS